MFLVGGDEDRLPSAEPWINAPQRLRGGICFSRVLEGNEENIEMQRFNAAFGSAVNHFFIEPSPRGRGSGGLELLSEIAPG
jgi:hypothetical protein